MNTTMLRSNRSFKFPALLACVAMLLTPLAGRADVDVDTPADIFPGVYKLTVTPGSTGAAAGRQEFAEYVQFEHSVFTAESCAKLGFAPTNYTVKKVNNVTVFEVTMTSGTQGTMQWTGRRSGSSLVGSLVWTKSTDVFTYTFVGNSTDVPVEPEVEDDD